MMAWPASRTQETFVTVSGKFYKQQNRKNKRGSRYHSWKAFLTQGNRFSRGQDQMISKGPFFPFMHRAMGQRSSQGRRVPDKGHKQEEISLIIFWQDRAELNPGLGAQPPSNSALPASLSACRAVQSEAAAHQPHAWEAHQINFKLRTHIFPLPEQKEKPFTATHPAFLLSNTKSIRSESPNRNQGDSSFT